MSGDGSCIRMCKRCRQWALCCPHLKEAVSTGLEQAGACPCDPWEGPLAAGSTFRACVKKGCGRLLCGGCAARVFIPNAGLEPQPMCRDGCAPPPAQPDLLTICHTSNMPSAQRTKLIPCYRMAAAAAAIFRPECLALADLLDETSENPAGLPGTPTPHAASQPGPQLPPFVSGAAYVTRRGALLWDAHHFLPKAYLNGIPQAGKGEVEAVRPGETLLLESLGLGCTQQHVGALRLAGVLLGVRGAAGLGLDPIHRHALGERCRVVPFTCRHWSAEGAALGGASPLGSAPQASVPHAVQSVPNTTGLPRMCNECAAMFAIPNACGQRRGLDTLDITIRCSQHVPAIATALLLLVVLRERLADEQVVGRVTLEEVQVYACPNPGCASAHTLPQRSYTDIVTGALGYGPACPSCGNLAGFVDALGLPGVPHTHTGKALQAVDTPHVGVSVAGCLDVELSSAEDVQALLQRYVPSVLTWYRGRATIATEGHAVQCEGSCLGLCSGAARGGMVASMVGQHQQQHHHDPEIQI